jgi:hypothetical protein
MDKTLRDALSDASALVQQAEGGDHIAARELIVRAAKEIDEGRLNDPALRRFIAQGLTSLLNDGPKKAFHLGKRRGPSTTHTVEMQELIAESIQHSGLGFHKSDSRDDHKIGAYTGAAEEYNITATTAQTYHKKHISKLLEEERIQDEFRREHERE